MPLKSIKAGQSIGHRYRVERALGSEEPATVFLCTDLRDGYSRVALRALPVSAPDDRYLASLRQRFSGLSRVRHPYLAKYLDLGMIEGERRPFLVTEFVDGENIFAASEGWSVGKIVQAAVTICRALQHLHSEQVVHGDLKASSVICAKLDGELERIKLLDFGLGLETQFRTYGSTSAARFAYSAPEVLLGRQPGVASDLYSLGVLIYLLLTRRLPFEQDDQGYMVQKHLQGRADMRPIERIESGSGLARALSDMLEKDTERRPTSVAEVIRLLSAATGRDYSGGIRAPVQGFFSQTRFVGREEEMSFLQKRAESVRQGGRGFTIFVVGEAGSGKTRCMEEFRIWALLNGWRIVEGRCLPRDSRSYGPYRQVLSSTMARAGDSAGRFSPDQVFQFVAEPGMTNEEIHGISAESAAGQYRDLLAREILRCLTNGPTLLFLHDFHWADEATTTVLEYLTSDILSHPILICVSLRPCEAERSPIASLIAQCSRQLRSETLALSALSAGSVEDLVASMTGDASLGKKLGKEVHKSCGGNPFFAEEIVKHLAERGLLRKGVEGWNFSQDNLERLEVPASIAVIFRNRLALLSPAARDLARWLAVFNRAVTLDLLRAAASIDKIEMTRAIEELLSGQTMRIVSGEGGDCLEFRHALIGEVVRDDLARAQLKSMHRRIGEAIESRLGPEQHFLELATHYTEGNCGEKAIRYALKAAAAYRAEFANSAALKLFEYLLLQERRLSNEELCEVAINASEIYCALGRARCAIKILRRVVERVGKAVPRHLRALLLAHSANAYQHLGDARGLERSAREGLCVIGKYNTESIRPIRALLFKLSAFGALLESRPRQGLLLLRRALHALPRSGQRILAGHLYSSISAMQRVACNFREASDAGRRAVILLDSDKTRDLQSVACSILGCALHSNGRFGSALKSHERAVQLAQSTRSPIVAALVFGNIAECLCRSGNLKEATNYSDQALPVSAESGNASVQHACETVRAEIMLSQGRYHTAITMLDRLNLQIKPALFVYSRAHALFLSAWIATELGDFRSMEGLLKKLGRCSAYAPVYEHELAQILKAREYCQRDLPKKAVSLLSNLNRALAKKRWPYHRCWVKIRMSEAMLVSGDYVSAEKAARDATRLARVMPSHRLEGYARYFRARSVKGLLRMELSSGSAKVEAEMPSKEEMVAVRDELLRALGHAETANDLELIWRTAAELSKVQEILQEFESSTTFSRKALDCLNTLEQEVPSAHLSSYRQLPERARARRECEERLHRLEFSHWRRSQDFERIEAEQLRCLFRISGMMNRTRDLNPLIELISAQLLQITTMGRAVVFLAEESSGKLHLAGKSVASDIAEIPYLSKQMVCEVYSSGHPLLSFDCTRDDRLSSFFEGNEASRPGSMYCAPLIAGARIIGALYADHPRGRDQLGDSAINLFAAFCNLSAVAVDNALAHQQLLREKAELQHHLIRATHGYPEIVGKSPIMDRLRERIALVAASPLDVLIVGESGTGKELVARALHRTGRRSGGRFVPLDCGALSDSLMESELFGYRKGAFTGATENRAGLLESANGGMVFLDEISNLTLKLQGKLLRVLQEREVRRLGETQHRAIDVQIIAATNRNLVEETRKGRFRKDLYYRLNMMQIQLAPLREHLEDVPLLLDWFLGAIAPMEGGRRKSFSPEAFRYLTRYSYPGNVRELRNIVQSSYYSCPGSLIQFEHLPAELRESAAEQPSAGREVAARSLYDRIREGGGNFEEQVKQPFLRRNFGRNVVRQVLRYALLDAEGRYRDAFRLLGIPAAQYSSVLIFLKRHSCYLDFRAFRQLGGSRVQ